MRLTTYHVVAANTRRNPARCDFTVEAANDTTAYRIAKTEAAKRLFTPESGVRVLSLRTKK